MTEIERRALERLRSQGPMTASELGLELWKEPGRWMSAASQSSNRYARAAGKVLAGLRRQGLVRQRSRGNRFEWEAYR